MTRLARRLLATIGLAAIALLAVVAAPAASVPLQVGDSAPTFRTTAALGGKTFEFDLAAALRKGPVVLYFFPKAFTHGCTIEAHAFADATPHFAALGATVIGISHDDIETLKRFSTEACRDKFAVGSDPQARTIHAYGAASLLPGMASRISYVIGQDDKVVFVHEGSDPVKHVAETLQAVQRLAAARR